jgi:hypothetical protein
MTEVKAVTGEGKAPRVMSEKDRFQAFKRWLWSLMATRALLLGNGEVIICKNEFSPQREFKCIGHACEHFAYLMNDSDRNILLS